MIEPNVENSLKTRQAFAFLLLLPLRTYLSIYLSIYPGAHTALVAHGVTYYSSFIHDREQSTERCCLRHVHPLPFGALPLSSVQVQTK